jgi:hypothetical protein
MLLPPIAAAAASSPAVAISGNVFFTLACFGLGLPASVAIFPQHGDIAVEQIEIESVRAEATKRGLTHVKYNKGL